MRTETDLLHGSIGDKLIRIALPLAATAVLQQLFNAADIAVVGRFVGEAAMAAVGGNAPVVALVVNLFFVLALGMGAGGVAAATALSNLLSASALFVLLCRSRSELRVVPRELRFEPRMLRNILRIGIPAGLQSMVFALANVCVQSAINSLGTTIIAASSAAYNLEILSYYFCNFFAQACTTMVGQNYGAGNLDRCRATLRTTLVLDFAFTAASGALLMIFAYPLLGLFNDEPEVIRYGVYRLRLLVLCYAFSICIDVFFGYLRAFGEAMAPPVASLVCACGTRIVWVFLIFPHHRSFEHLIRVYPISLGMTALVIVTWWALWRRRGERIT